MILPARAPRRLLAAALVVGTVAGCAVGTAVGIAVAGPAVAVNPPGPNDPIGHVDSMTVAPVPTPPATTPPTGTAAPSPIMIDVSGWAADPDEPSGNPIVYGLVDGRVAVRSATSITRPAISRRHRLGATPGFSLTVPVPAGRHTLCIGVQNLGPGLAVLLTCRAVPLGSTLTAAQAALRSPVGSLTTVGVTAPRATARTGRGSTLRVTGWAEDPDFVSRRVVAVVYVDGESVATLATRGSSMAQRRAGAGRWGAIDISVAVSSGSHLACVWLVNVGFGANTSLGCDAVDTRGRAGTAPVTSPRINLAVVAEAEKHRGQRYVFGAIGPRSFDCSGLVMYSYGKSHLLTPRVAAAQFAAARVIQAARAVPGDLVFWHDGVGDVYHVSIYLAPGRAFAAIDEQEGVNFQSLYDQTILSYGSFTHT